MMLRVVVIFLIFMMLMAFLQRLFARKKHGNARLGLTCPGCGRIRVSTGAKCSRPGCR